MRIVLHIILTLVVTLSLSAQSFKKEEAKSFFVHQRYEDAVSVLKTADELVKSDSEARFILAVSYYQLNQLELAARIFSELVKQEKEPFPESWLYLGKIHHAMNQFEQAIDYYKSYLRRLKPNSSNRKMVWDDIRRCGTGMRLKYQHSAVYAENLGPLVNTSGDEFAPVVSPNFSNRLYFSSMREGNLGGRRDENGMPDSRDGHYFSDIYSCRSNTGGGGGWQDVQSLGYLVNSTRHDVLLDFNSDGKVLYFFQGWQPESGKIIVDTFRNKQERTVSSDVFAGPLSPGIGDEAFFFANEHLVYFASRRPGGYGGLDIYRLAYENGDWGRPQNLGPQINTPYDETTPFLARDGLTLYYSTNHPDLSIGGLDVVKAVYNPRSEKWTWPENLLTHINSSEDDAYFRISKDGFTGYFSSSRKDGYGQRDLYAAHFDNFLPEMELRVGAMAAVAPPELIAPQVTPPQEDMAANPEAASTPQEPERPDSYQEPGLAEASTVEPPPAIPDLPRVATSPPVAMSTFAPLTLVPEQGLKGEKADQINQIAGVMAKEESVYLVVTAYQTASLPKGQALFNALRAAEAVGARLVEQGVAQRRIFLRAGLSDTLPEEPARVDFCFYQPEGLPQKAALPTLKSGYRPAVPRHAFHQPLLYKVQVASLSGAYQSDRMDAYDGAMVERQMDSPYYRYTLGAFATFEEADAFREHLLNGPFTSAYVTAYVLGRRAGQKRAQQHAEDFPDLSNYAN